MAKAKAKKVDVVEVFSNGNGKQVVSKAVRITTLAGVYHLQRCCPAPFGRPVAITVEAGKPSSWL
jgi:hypothetical protein